ncbi:MAG: glutamate 5-kinase [Oscillospiraceae bacterium]|nr:glutamate 5-kinase [Oscillospiraceae bacterium]MBQ4539004.1 glutamate 5-kinase [Oscillospiraceae bacterium]
MNRFVNAKRIVIKIGTTTLTHGGGLLNYRRMEHLIKTIADLKNSGKEIVLVSSGAIGVGMGELGLKVRPSDVPTRQACAAVGQCELMYTYDKMFGEYNHPVAQILLTRDVVEQQERKQNVINTFERLLEFGVIPIVNENDAVSTEEIFGDNDTLSAIVATLINADLLILLSDIDGLYTANPKEDPTAELIPVVEDIASVRHLAGGSSSSFGTGGMVTKLNAAEIACSVGIDMAILNGASPELMYDLFDGKEIGTYFVGRK